MLNKTFRAALSLLLAFSLLLGMSANGLAALMEGTRTSGVPGEDSTGKTLNYVSIGDSMTNGYGFEGYEQCNATNNNYDFIAGKNVYGEGSYALQFEEYLKGKGYDVNHTKLAPSALLADDLLYLLGAREEEFDDDWAGYRDYVGDYDKPEKIDQLKAHFQTAVTEADIITMCIGNASFGAYLVQQVTEVIGIMGGTSQVDPQLTLENGLALLEDEEAKKIVLDIYADMKADINEYIDGVELPMELNIDALLDLVAYTVASFLVSYEELVDTIVEMNPDVEIILIGLMNTTYGMTITGEDFEFPFGDMMDNAFEALNNYIAGVPTAKQLAGEYEEATFYYADQPAPEFIVQAFDDLAANNWENIDNGRLSGKIVRQRNIDAYNSSLRYAIGAALNLNLPDISLDDLNSGKYVIGDEPIISFPGTPHENYDSYGDYANGAPSQEFIDKYISVAIYLAIEEAVVDNVDTMDITVDGLLGIAGNIFGALGEMPPALSQNPGPWTIKTTLVNWFNGSENGRAMCKVYALFKVGNGMSVHPTPTGHDNIAKAVIAAYENEYTAAQKTLDTAIYLITEYYDEAYAYAYAYADKNGYIADAVAAIDGVIAALKAIEVPGTDAFQAEVAAEIEEIIETLESAKALLTEADVLDQASLDALLATLNEAADAMVQLVNVLEQAGVDVTELVIIPALEQAYDVLVNEVIPAVTEALEEAVKAGTEYLMEKLGEAYDALVKATIEAVKKYAPEVADAVYNYLYNNPEEVIAFFAEYGPYMMELVKEYGDEALMVVGYVLYNYGDEIAAYVVENHETILAAIVSWTEIHGENTAELIQVYAEALGLCDAVREQIAELEKELAELEKELNNKIAEMEKELADLYEQLETAVGEKKAEIEAKIAALEAEIAALKASLEAKIAEVKAAIAELKAALQEAIDSGLTKLENLKDAIANLDDKIAELIDVAEKAALGEIRKAIEAIESAMKQLDEAIADLTGEVYGELKAALKELAFYVADEIVEAVKKYFPELADAIYNYLYNNPEEVIEFVKTYGPYLLEIAEEYGDEALAVVGYIFYMYGDEIAAYVIENHDTILTGLVEWFEVHGENTAELIQVYAEALGWCDAVRDQIAELEATLNELYAALENATGEAKEAIEAEIAKVEAAIAELKAELEALIDEINAIIADVNATVEEAIANVKAAIEELKEAVAELKAEVEKLLEEVKVAIKNEIDSVIEAVVAELEELLNKQIETLEDVVDALEEAVLKSVEELKAIVDQLVYDATHADYEIDMDSYYLAIGSDPEFAKLLAQALGLDKRYGVTDWDNVDYESILKADLITLSYNENQLSNFAFNQAFGYVADYVNVDFRNSLVAYVVETMKEVLPKMLPALSDAAINEYVAIVSAQINGTIDQLSAEYFGDATAAEMDWTTIVGSDNLGYVDAARDEMKNAFLDAGVPETYAYQIPVLDYLYENLEMLGELGELMAMFDKEIVYEMFGERANYTMEIPVADALTFAGESYAFGYAQFNVQYAETVLTINKINPDAILVLLGHYNAFQGIEFEVNGTSVNLGNIYGNFANVTSAHSFAYALLQENTIFVDISDAETVFGAYGTESETSVMDFVNAYLSDSTITSVSEAGHEYIKEQILNALNVTRKLLGDVDGDGDVDNLDAMMVLQYDAMLITKDDLDLSVGDVDGDGDVDNVDAMLILQFDAELISAFPAEN